MVESPPPANGSPMVPGYRTGMWLLLGAATIWAVYLVGRPHAEVDCVAAPYTAWSIVRYGSLDLSRYQELRPLVRSQIRELPDGTWLSIRPPGTALAALPFLAPLALTRDSPPGTETMLCLGKVIAAIYVAGATVVFMLLCWRVAPGAVRPATLLFAFGSCLWSVGSQALWMHGPATFWLCCALYLLVRPVQELTWKRMVLAGFAYGLAVITRPTTAFFICAAGATLLSRRRWRPALHLGLGAGLLIVVLCTLNFTSFGHPLLGGYEQDDWTMPTPLWLGVSGLLISPSRGLLVYSPALLLAPIGAWVMCRRKGGANWEYRDMILGQMIAALATLVFHAKWHDWRGGWCYGPRFLCETMPIGCLLFAMGYDNLPSVSYRRLAGLLVSLSVLIHFLGVAGYGAHTAWHMRHSFPDQGRCLFAIRDTEIEAHARAFLHKINKR
jgi:hypothetical protein